MKKELIDYDMFARLLDHLFDCIYLEDQEMIQNAESNLKKIAIDKGWMDKYVADHNAAYHINIENQSIH